MAYIIDIGDIGYLAPPYFNEDLGVSFSVSDSVITSENFVVVYIMGDVESQEFADYYAGKHNMSTTDVVASGATWEVNGQTIGVLSSNTEILNNESEFNIQVLYPLREALDFLDDTRKVWGILLGFKIPGGFYHNDDPSENPSDNILVADVISSTSRVARGCAKLDGVYHSFAKPTANKLYNRKEFKRFDSIDAEHTLIVSRIDAPSLLLAKQYVDQAEELNGQLFVNGTFYLDPYSDRVGPEPDAYKNNLLDFASSTLPKLNLETWMTTFMDPYIDVAIPFVENDSFVWSWFTNRAASDFFQTTSAIRVFLYNADFDGGFTVRDNDGLTWPTLSMKNGYVLSAGAMSNPGITGFLNPSPFFEALIRTSTIGEAYYFSLPHVDWTISLFGDPLTTVFFPGLLEIDDESIEENESWRLMSKDLARVAAHLYKKEQEAEQIRTEIVDLVSKDADVVLALLYESNDNYLRHQELVWQSELTVLVEALFSYPEQRFRFQGLSLEYPTIDDYLTEKEFKVSGLLNDIYGGTETGLISTDNLLDEGWWEFEYVVQDDSFNFVNYHFLLDVYSSEDLSHDSLLISLDSYSTDSWSYEKVKDEFSQITSSGVSSSFIGRRIRYQSRADDLLVQYGEYLTRGETYYFVITQYTRGTDPFTYYTPRSYDDIIYT